MKIQSLKRRKRFNTDKLFDLVNVVIMLVLLVIFTWPLWFVLIASISDPILVMTGKVLVIPKGITQAGYEQMLEYKELWTGYANSIFITVVGTLLNLIMSVCFAYPLADKNFMPRRVLLLVFMFTMYFSGGLIPGYLVVRRLGLLDTLWAMIIPSLVSVYNSLVIRSYFINSIPGELEEASLLDGANSAQYLWKVVLPLSKPVLAVVGLYYAVSHWNDYYSALIYLYKEELYPVQTVLRNLLLSAQVLLNDTSGVVDAALIEEAFNRAMTMKYSVIIVAALPMLCIYPFVQKFFVKGVMVGAVKG